MGPKCPNGPNGLNLRISDTFLSQNHLFWLILHVLKHDQQEQVVFIFCLKFFQSIKFDQMSPVSQLVSNVFSSVSNHQIFYILDINLSQSSMKLGLTIQAQICLIHKFQLILNIWIQNYDILTCTVIFPSQKIFLSSKLILKWSLTGSLFGGYSTIGLVIQFYFVKSFRPIRLHHFSNINNMSTLENVSRYFAR